MLIQLLAGMERLREYPVDAVPARLYTRQVENGISLDHADPAAAPGNKELDESHACYWFLEKL